MGSVYDKSSLFEKSSINYWLAKSRKRSRPPMKIEVPVKNKYVIVKVVLRNKTLLRVSLHLRFVAFIMPGHTVGG